MCALNIINNLLSSFLCLSAEIERFNESSLPLSLSPGPADLDRPLDFPSLRFIVPKKSLLFLDLPLLSSAEGRGGGS